jgi:hypothetical protein
MTTTVTTPAEEKILKVDCLGRVKTPLEEREALLDRFEHSGLPATQFAKRHGINYQTFATWVQKRRRKNGDYEKLRTKTASAKNDKTPDPIAAPAPDEPLALTEVVLQAGEQTERNGPCDGLRLELPGGVRLVVSERTQLELAAELIRTLNASNTSPSC